MKMRTRSKRSKVTKVSFSVEYFWLSGRGEGFLNFPALWCSDSHLKDPNFKPKLPHFCPKCKNAFKYESMMKRHFKDTTCGKTTKWSKLNCYFLSLLNTEIVLNSIYHSAQNPAPFADSPRYSTAEPTLSKKFRM